MVAEGTCVGGGSAEPLSDPKGDSLGGGGILPEALEWTKGYTWGLRLYKERYDEGMLFTTKLIIKTPPTLLWVPTKSWPQLNPRPSPSSHSHGTETPLKRVTETAPLNLPEQSHLTHLVQEAFRVINSTNPEATKSCWLCYDVTPPYYEGMTFIKAVNHSDDSTTCQWKQQSARLTLPAITGQGLCVGTVPHTHNSCTRSTGQEE